MVVFPKAKINFGLMITGRRHDGYHDIETILYPVDLCDALEVVAREGNSVTDNLTVTGIIPDCSTDDNLVVRVVRNIRESYPVPFVKIHLHKMIPAGTGLGGGSSDAAGMVRIVNKEFNLGMDTAGMRNLVAPMGSDCPFFIESVPAIASCRGDVLNPVQPFLEGLYILLLYPGFTVSTREAYENCESSKPPISLNEAVNMQISEWKSLIVNDFEKTIFKKYPQIRDLKEELYYTGALYSSMSGSGSAVYGIFAGEPVIPDNLRKYVIFKGKL